MVGYDPAKVKLSNLDIAVAAATSGVLTRAICQPLDVIKIRFQLQHEAKDKVRYHNIIQTTALIVKEEGIGGLWKGHVPAQMLSFVFGVTQFSVYEMLTRRFFLHQHYVREELRPAFHFTCGAIAGCTSTLVSFPFDVVRTRLISQTLRDDKLYTGVINAFIHINKTENFFTLFRGLYPTMLQVAPYAGAQFMFYKIFTVFYETYLLNYEEYVKSFAVPMSESLFCGSCAGLCAKTVVYPLDLAKKRLQIQGMKRWFMSTERFICKGLTDCLVKTIKKEGFTGLYKGLLPSMIKAFCTSGLQFGIYEETCNLLRTYRLSNYK